MDLSNLSIVTLLTGLLFTPGTTNRFLGVTLAFTNLLCSPTGGTGGF